ncbi:hypothetical protein like AT5G03230 [Hibiscus trionum]|uniref:Senescence regulator n=1 Tax=Hibiscus trionum TaxID=183268 RepID=A0A9W7J023_HIBTR|nr:hypothetical protein like AT5G03230 [Hibiscus trionum]
MASRKIFFGSKPSYIYPAKQFDDGDDIVINDGVFELDEADVWSYNSNEAITSAQQDGKKPLPSSRAPSNKLPRKMEFISANHKTQKEASASVPVNVPDWSKILKADYRVHGDSSASDGGDGDGRVPPHEYLPRRRGASFSVHEGIGRTLKGRDLRCVRNAVWKKTGFED